MALFNKNKMRAKLSDLAKAKKPKKYTLLIVDDEKPNREVLVGVLENDYNLLVANDGQEALDLVKNHPDPSQIHVIISDQRMPKLSGVEFLKQTIKLTPKTIRVLLTAFTDRDAVIDSINDGQIYKFIHKPFDADDLKVTIRRALESFELEKKNLELLQVFEKFVPTQFLNRIAPEGLQHLQFGQARMERLSILFSGIQAFTHLSGSMLPQELLDFLNAYSQKISEPIHHHHGFIDKFVGNGIMALFDRSKPTQENHAQDAVNAAITMQLAINDYNQFLEDHGIPPIKIGIGVHSGETIVGTMGAKDRMDSTALGDSVNLASRLEKLTQIYKAKILISEATYRLLAPNQLRIREIDTIQVKGKKQPVKVFEVCDADPPDILEKKLQTREQFAKGMQLYHANELEKALSCFESCLSVFPQDVVVSEYIKKQYLFEETSSTSGSPFY